MSEIKYWELRALHYSQLCWVSDEKLLAEFVDFCSVSDGDIVLDGGCGTGAVSLALDGSARIVVALDSSIDMIHGGGLHKAFPCIVSSLEDYVGADKCFDKIICRMVFHHIHDVERGFKNCYRMIAKGGWLVIQQAVPPSDSSVVREWYESAMDRMQKKHVFSRYDLEGHFRNAEFSDVNSREFRQVFSVNNWLDHSGLSESRKRDVMRMHINAPREVKDAYDMKVDEDEVWITVKFLFMKGRKM